jgi:hypothetical protein
MKRLFFLLKVSYYYAIFRIMRDIRLNHVVEKDANEFASYLEVVYQVKMKNILDKRAKMFFYEEK